MLPCIINLKNLNLMKNFKTFAKFAKKLKNTRDQLIIDNYSNKIIVIDEVHNLRIHHEKEEALEIVKKKPLAKD